MASCAVALGVVVHRLAAPTPVRWDASMKSKLVTEACSVQLAAVVRAGMPVNDLQARPERPCTSCQTLGVASRA